MSVDVGLNFMFNVKFLSLEGLSHEQNLRKMRFLSFVQLAEDKKEIEYAVIQREMQLEEADIEDFIIDGKRRLIFGALFAILLHSSVLQFWKSPVCIQIYVPLIQA